MIDKNVINNSENITMYINIENDIFIGFSDIKTENSIKISKNEYEKLLKLQSEGKQIYWNKKSKKLQSKELLFGEKIENGEIITDLDLIKNNKLEQISNIKTNKLSDGFKVKIGTKTLVCRTRQNDQTNIQSLLMTEMNKINFKFKDERLEKDIFVEITKEQLNKILNKSVEYISENIEISSSLKEKINKIKTAKSLNNIDIEEEYNKKLSNKIIKF